MTHHGEKRLKHASAKNLVIMNSSIILVVILNVVLFLFFFDKCCQLCAHLQGLSQVPQFRTSHKAEGPFAQVKSLN